MAGIDLRGPSSGSAASASFADKSAWAATTAYAVGDVVTYNGIRYITKTAHTSTSTFDSSKFVLISASDTTLAIPSLEGVKGFVYGHSYATGTGASGTVGWSQRLQTRLRFGSVGNQAVGGMMMPDICTKVAQTWPTGGSTGVIFVEGVLNDSSKGGSALSVTGLTNAAHAAVEFLRSSARTEDTAATYTGTWTASTTDTAASGSSSHSTTTQNDSFVLNMQGSAFTLMFFGNDDTNFGTAGGTVQVAVDGTVVATQSLSNQMAKTTTYSTPQSKVHVPIVVTGLAPGWHRVVCTKTDATGSIVAFDCAVTPATYPPTVVFVKDGQVPGNGYTSVAAYNTVLDTIAALYPTNHVLAVPVSSAWDGTSTISVADGLHPGDYGHEVILNQIAQTLTGLPFRGGLNTAALTDAPPAPTPASPADNFNRADNASSMGVTSTGSVPWQVENSGLVWGISSNRAYCSLAPASGGVTVETGKSDCTITATLAVTSVNNIGVRFRYGDSGVGLVWFAGAGVYTLSGGNVSTQIATPGNYTTGDTVQIVLSGSSITFKKNGATLTTITSAVGQTNTRHGFQSNSDTTARWDDFSVV